MKPPHGMIVHLGPYTKIYANTFVHARAYRVFLTSCVRITRTGTPPLIPPHSVEKPHTFLHPSRIVTMSGSCISDTWPIICCSYEFISALRADINSIRGLRPLMIPWRLPSANNRRQTIALQLISVIAKLLLPLSDRNTITHN